MKTGFCKTIIPTTDRPTFERAVESVLTQDIEPDLHDIIVVNDSGRMVDDLNVLSTSESDLDKFKMHPTT
jgi:cellulose synthase/poly-beta-1,6-N-acetylglucosamine synthase-like glycosyltransferase